MNVARLVALLGVVLLYLEGASVAHVTGSSVVGLLFGTLPASVLFVAAFATGGFRGARRPVVVASYAAALVLLQAAAPVAAAPLSVVPDGLELPNVLLWSWPPKKEDYLRLAGTAAVVGIGCAAGVFTFGATCAGGIAAGVALNTALDVGANVVTGNAGDAQIFRTGRALGDLVVDPSWDAAGRLASGGMGIAAPGTASLADKVERGQPVDALDLLGAAGDAIPAKAFGATKAAKAAGGALDVAKGGNAAKGARTVTDYGSFVRTADATQALAKEARAVEEAAKAASKTPVTVAAKAPAAPKYFQRLTGKAPIGPWDARAPKLVKTATAKVAKGTKATFKTTAQVEAGAVNAYLRGLKRVARTKPLATFGAKHPKTVWLAAGLSKRPRGFLKTASYLTSNGADNLGRDYCAECSPQPPGLSCEEASAARGWDAEVWCRSDVQDYQDCMEEERDPAACKALLDGVTVAQICEATKNDKCPRETCPPTCAPDPRPPDYEDCLATWKSETLCAWIVEGADPYQSILNLFLENNRPVLSAGGPRHFHERGEGSLYEVAVRIDRGWGLKCADVEAYVRYIGACLDRYRIDVMTVAQEAGGQAIHHETLTRDDLLANGILDSSTETAVLLLPFALEYGTGPTQIGYTVRVDYHLVHIEADGTETGATTAAPVVLERHHDVTPCESREACEDKPDVDDSPSGGDDGVTGGDQDAPACDLNDPECLAERADQSLGGFGLGRLTDWRLWILIVGAFLFVATWRNGKLHVWTRGGLGRKPRAGFELHKRPGLLDRLKAKLTGKPPAPRLKDAYLAGAEVPLTAPPNRDGSGPDWNAAERRLRGRDEDDA